MNINLNKFNDEVFFSEDSITRLNQSDVASLKDRALENLRKRARICAHLNVDDSLHEMFIVYARGTYVRPHKHLNNKSESLHVIDGTLDVVIFDELAVVIAVVPAHGGARP